MEKRVYAEEIAMRIEGATVAEVDKANGIILTGIAVPIAENVKANVYIDSMYDIDMTIDEAVAEINHIVEERKKHNPVPDMSCFSNFDKMKGHLKARLYNKATVAEVSKSASEYGFDDLIIVPYLEITLNGGYGAIKVLENHLETWGKTAEEVIAIAEENSANETMITSMAEMLGMSSDMLPPGTPMMMVVSNDSEACGAYGIIAKMEYLKEKFPEGFAVLPSSIHEVIVMSLAGVDEDALTSMVKEVNATEVVAEEQLSDHAYFFR